MIFYYLWKYRVSARADREKLLFFFGFVAEPLALSKRWPLATAVNWIKAVFLPSYARAVVVWLRYRIELYDGLQG